MSEKLDGIHVIWDGYDTLYQRFPFKKIKAPAFILEKLPNIVAEGELWYITAFHVVTNRFGPNSHGKVIQAIRGNEMEQSLEDLAKGIQVTLIFYLSRH